MAISCEVFVKSSLFSGSPISEAIFDFLSSKRKIEVTVQELLNNPVKEALGSSFKEDHAQHWKNIGYLFQTRNKIAHSGICVYKNDKGKVFEVDEEVLNEWWESLEALFSWMAEKNH